MGGDLHDGVAKSEAVCARNVDARTLWKSSTRAVCTSVEHLPKKNIFRKARRVSVCAGLRAPVKVFYNCSTAGFSCRSEDWCGFQGYAILGRFLVQSIS